MSDWVFFASSISRNSPISLFTEQTPPRAVRRAQTEGRGFGVARRGPNAGYVVGAPAGNALGPPPPAVPVYPPGCLDSGGFRRHFSVAVALETLRFLFATGRPNVPFPWQTRRGGWIQRGPRRGQTGRGISSVGCIQRRPRRRTWGKPPTPYEGMLHDRASGPKCGLLKAAPKIFCVSCKFPRDFQPLTPKQNGGITIDSVDRSRRPADVLVAGGVRACLQNSQR